MIIFTFLSIDLEDRIKFSLLEYIGLYEVTYLYYFFKDSKS